MGTVYKKAWTAPLPRGAEIVVRRGQPTARWRIRNGELRTAEVFTTVTGCSRIRGATKSYIAKYRDAAGVWIEYPTKCHDETAARAILVNLERRAELVRAGVLSADEASASRHGSTGIEQHLDAWQDHLRLKGASKAWYSQARRRVMRVVADRRIKSLRGLTADAVETWLGEQAVLGMSAATRNEYRGTCVTFMNWCVRTKRVMQNPLLVVAVASRRVDVRRQRRAMTEAELTRLLSAARQRPLAEAEMVRRGNDKGHRVAKVAPATRDRLERLGRERELLYKTLVLTGLRKSELASITIGQVELTGAGGHVELLAKDEKNRRGARMPIRADLASDLLAWLDSRLELARAQARAAGEPIPLALSSRERLFRVPDKLSRIFNRDLVFAGLARVVRRGGREVVMKTDDRGCTVDVHALRHTFCTHLAMGGVSQRIVQDAMRHSDPSLTANVYTDPRQLDVAGALDVLPRLPLSPASPPGAATSMATTG